MTHTAEKKWAQVSGQASERLRALVQELAAAEQLHQDMLEMWSYHNSDATSLAAQLFRNDVPTAEQQAMLADMRAAMVAAHNAYTSFDFAAVRRMI